MLRYRPHILLRNGHLQTMFGSLTHGVRPPHHAELVKIPLDDGEFVVAHEERGGMLAEDCPTVILVHGLGGSHRSPYMQRIANLLNSQRLRCWRMDLRGSGAGLRYGCRPAHAGSSDDLAAVVNAAARLYPQAPIYLVGFSLGGGILLKMLGEAASGELNVTFDMSRIARALAVAPPIDLERCSSNMERPSRMIYTRYYLHMLSKQVSRRAEVWPQWRAIRQRPAVKSIRQFDARYTVPLAGFESAEQYYASCSSAQWLSSIVTPTTILVDRDDPIVPLDSFRSIPQRAELKLEFTQYGGHLGYIGRDDMGRTMRWMDHWVVQRIKLEK